MNYEVKVSSGWEGAGILVGQVEFVESTGQRRSERFLQNGTRNHHPNGTYIYARSTNSQYILACCPAG